MYDLTFYRCPTAGHYYPCEGDSLVRSPSILEQSAHQCSVRSSVFGSIRETTVRSSVLVQLVTQDVPR